MKFLLISSKDRLGIACLLLLAMFGLTAISSRAQSSVSNYLGPDTVTWRRLTFNGNSFFGKVNTEVRLAVLPVEAAMAQLMAAPQGTAVPASGATLLNITVDSHIQPQIGSTENFKTQSWCNPKNLAALQRVRLRQGRKIWQKAYRFTNNGVYRLRKRPVGKKEEKLAPAQWTSIMTEFHPYDSKDLGCSAVLEPAGLLYMSSAIDFMRQKTPLSLCVFNKQQLHRVKVYISGNERMKVNYLEKTLENEILREDMIDAVKISFQPHSLAPPTAKVEKFSFLGLKGDFDIFIDRATRLPVRVYGQIDVVGKVELQLNNVEF